MCFGKRVHEVSYGTQCLRCGRKWVHLNEPNPTQPNPRVNPAHPMPMCPLNFLSNRENAGRGDWQSFHAALHGYAVTGAVAQWKEFCLVTRRVWAQLLPMPLHSSPRQVACLSLFHASDSFTKELQLACKKINEH